MHSGTREKVLYIPFIPVHSSSTSATKPDYLATIDVDPSSSTFGQVLHRVFAQAGDELHHTGWNTCSSCHGDPTKQRRYLVVPALQSGNIYIFDTEDERKPRLHKFIDGNIIKEKYKLTWPHTTHCLATGELMISYIGNQREEGTGGFLLFDEHFNPSKRWEHETTPYGYDFWYQPKHNVMVSSGWGNPNKIKHGFNPAEVGSDYGSEIFFWDWKQRKIIQKENLGDKGLLPLEVRFLHDPKSTHGFVAAALSSNVIHFWKDEKEDKWKWDVVISVPWKEVEGWALPKMPSLITDFVISLDDKYVYLSNWLHGDVRQYDISDISKPKLVGQVFLGGVIRPDGSIKEKSNEGNDDIKDVKKIFKLKNGKEIQGGPQMIQLSLDGKRLYVTTSLFSVWDKQFYPSLAEKGGSLLQIDVDVKNGGLKLNDQFFVDLENEPLGPVLAHEVRYPGGDCTSDIWLEQ